MHTFDTWESYFYPPPDNATMRNVEDIRDSEELHLFEYGATFERQRQLDEDPVLITQTYDAAHLRSIHLTLFQDVYEWAGQYRTVGIEKNLSAFADPADIGRYLTDVHRVIEAAAWSTMSRAEFAETAAEVFASLNQAHPFRDGNGRTSKVFMEHVGQMSRFTFDYALVSPRLWNQTSMLSGPDLGTYEPVPDSLVPVLYAIAQPRGR